METVGPKIRFVEVDYLPRGQEFKELPASVARAYGTDDLTFRIRNFYAGWHNSGFYLCKDSKSLITTGVRRARGSQVHPDPDCNTLSVLSTSHYHQVAIADGRVVQSLSLPDQTFRGGACLHDGRIALLSDHHSVVLCRAVDGVLKPESAWAFEGLYDFRVVCQGRALMVGGDQPAHLALWWLDGDPRVVTTFDQVEDFVAFEGSLDETGKHFVRPTQPYFWDGSHGFLVEGLEELVFDAATLASLPTPAAVEIPKAPTAVAWVPREVQSPKPAVAPAIPRLHAEAFKTPYLRALGYVLQQRPARSQPDAALLPLFDVPMPDALETLCAVIAWHGQHPLRLGEFWIGLPKERTDDRACNGTSRAIQIGTIANGDEVVVRVLGGSARVVELSHEEDTEIDRGLIEGFLRHCVAYARERNEPTSLDPYLPEDDRNGF